MTFNSSTLKISALLKDPWPAILWRVRKGEFPSDAELAAALRADATGKALADDVRAYLAGRLEGTIKRPRGRPRLLQDFKGWIDHINIATEVHILHAAYKLDGATRPRERAIEDASRAFHKSTETIRAKIKQLKKAPPMIRRAAYSAEDFVESLVRLRTKEGGGQTWLKEFIRSRKEGVE